VTGVNFLMVMEKVATQPTIRDRLTARLLARRLDWALANGVNSEQNPALALRARRLTALPRRRLIANALRRLLYAGRVKDDGRIQVAQLAEALAEPGPIDPRGAARAWLLVTDGTGPLHSRGNLRGYAASATRYLRPTPLP
jgi:hypothetical protein